MITYFFPKIINNSLYQKINKFLYSNLFIILVCILILLSYYLGLEIITYYVYALLGVVIALISDDMLPTVPLFCTGYMTISRNNTLLHHNTDSLIYTNMFKINVFIAGSIAFIALVSRLIFEIKTNKNISKPKMTVGLILITIAMPLGGIFTSYYCFRSFLYGLLVGISLSFCYFYFFYTIKWKNVRFDYFAYLFMFIGLSVGLQLLDSYISFDWQNLEFTRSEVYTGWGMYNNIGGILCTCIGAPFYLSITKKHGYLYIIVGIIIYLFTILTQSRNSILVGGFLLIISFIVATILTKNKKANIIVIIISFSLAIIGSLIFKNQIISVFQTMFSQGLSSNGRINHYKKGLEAYLESPVFGTGFFDYVHGIKVFFDETSFISPRYHNTIIQLIASTGTIGLLAYSYHRFQTIKMFVKNINMESIFIGICFIAIILNSLIDCHIFNFGPGLHYGVLLVFMECLNSKVITNEKFN